MADFATAATCLSGTYAGFVTQEIAKLTEKVTSVVASFTDPLDALAETNVQQLVDDVSSLSEGSIAGNLASIGAAIIINKVKRELRDALQDVIQRNPAIGDQIQRITNMTEAVYGIVSLAVLLRKEAPYSAVASIVEDMNEILDVKEATLNSLKTHIVQLNNVIMSATQDPEPDSAQLRADLQAASDALTAALNHLLALETTINATGVFTQKEFDQAESDLSDAEGLICPETDVNLLDLGQVLTGGAIPTGLDTKAQKQMSIFAMRPLTIVMNCELASVDRSVTRLNNFIAQLPNIIPDFEAASESVAMKDFRTKLVQQLRLRVMALRDDIDATLTDDSVSNISLHALSWCGRIGAINELVPSMEAKLQAGSKDETRFAAMDAELDAMLAALDAINGVNITAGIEDTTALKAQITTLINQGKAILSLIGTSKLTNYDIGSFQITVKSVTDGGGSAISASLDVISEIRDALSIFQTVPPADQRIDQLLSLLELMGMDRAKDLLKLGKFKDFLNTTIDDASYIGLAIGCLIEAEQVVTDTLTLQTLTEIRELLESQRVSELAAAFDIIDSGKNAAILEIQTKMEQAQGNLEKVNRIIETMTGLAETAGLVVEQLNEAAIGLGQQIGEIATGSGGPLNEVLSDLDIDGLQSGCSRQLRF